jgi:predicted DNA-binding protein YlxM (UPF0122 family)
VYHITRDEPAPSLYENADFSKDTIRDSIKDGESKTNEILHKMQIVTQAPKRSSSTHYQTKVIEDPDNVVKEISRLISNSYKV